MRARATAFLILGVTAMVALPGAGPRAVPGRYPWRSPRHPVLARHDDRRRPRRHAPGHDGHHAGTAPTRRVRRGCSSPRRRERRSVCSRTRPGPPPSRCCRARFRRPSHQLLRGSLLPGQVSGLLAQPAPADARFGEPGPATSRRPKTPSPGCTWWTASSPRARDAQSLGGDSQSGSRAGITPRSRRPQDRRPGHAALRSTGCGRRAGQPRQEMRKRLEPPPAPKKPERF